MTARGWFWLAVTLIAIVPALVAIVVTWRNRRNRLRSAYSVSLDRMAQSHYDIHRRRGESDDDLRVRCIEVIKRKPGR